MAQRRHIDYSFWYHHGQSLQQISETRKPQLVITGLGISTIVDDLLEVFVQGFGIVELFYIFVVHFSFSFFLLYFMIL
jgi:hypothetical protein